jgi:hypothetical protein
MLLSACIDRISLDVPNGDRHLVVEGLITDQPGPYSVTISRSFSNNDPAYGITPERGAKVSLYTDDVLVEELVEQGNGIYQITSVTGVVGRAYHIIIETKDGRRYTSEPEVLRPVGELTGIRAEFEARTIQTLDGEKDGDRFNIFIDGNITDEPESFVRWRFKGTYLVRTNPELAYGFLEGIKINTPYECSGYRSDFGGPLIYVQPCSCCTCWVTEHDDRWFVGRSADVTQAGYKDVFVGQANVTPLTFLERYRVEIEQMSLSPKAYDFFRQLEAQAQGVESLFQPATGPIKGNLAAMDSDERVLGLFYASSSKTISMDLLRSDVPYKVPQPDTIRTPCTGMRGSSNAKPAFW